MDSEQWARRLWKWLRNEPNWNCNKRRDLQNKGQEYDLLPKTSKSGMWQRSRWAGAVTVLCTVGTVDVNNRQKLFSGFYSFGSYDLQSAYLVGCCIKVLPTMVEAIGTGICATIIMSTMVVSLCMDARKPFLVSMMCHMAIVDQALKGGKNWTVVFQRLISGESTQTGQTEYIKKTLLWRPTLRPFPGTSVITLAKTGSIFLQSSISPGCMAFTCQSVERKGVRQ